MAEKNPLPATFFESAGLDAEWSLVRTQLLERLREENSSAENTLDLMLLERTSHIYTALRQKETGENPYDNMYKELMKLCIAMIESLRAQRDKDFIIEEARAEVIHAVAVSLKEALAPLPIAEQQLVMSRVQTLMGDM